MKPTPEGLAVAAANDMPKLGGLVDPTRAAWVVVDALRNAGWLNAPITVHIHGHIETCPSCRVIPCYCDTDVEEQP